jgi:uncharacterized membrane protein
MPAVRFPRRPSIDECALEASAVPFPGLVRTSRLEGLCDGVFAVALTLLVLDLPSPRGSQTLARDLLQQWPSYGAYVVSFATVGIIWMNHHALMDRVARADRGLLELNLLLLLFVALVPWPTSLAAQYLRDTRQASVAAVTYGLTFAALSASFGAIWLYLQRRESLAHTYARPHLAGARRRALGGVVAYLFGVGLAFIWAPAAFAAYALVAVYFAVSGRGVASRSSAVQNEASGEPG